MAAQCRVKQSVSTAKTVNKGSSPRSEHTRLHLKESSIVFSLLRVVKPQRSMASCLRDLLEEEYFLQKILMFMDYESFEDCLQVCQVWKRTCSKTMPAKLIKDSKFNAKNTSTALFEYSRAFPNAISLHFRVDITNVVQANKLFRLWRFLKISNM